MSKYCRYCGHRIREGEVKCPKCGKILTDKYINEDTKGHTNRRPLHLIMLTVGAVIGVIALGVLIRNLNINNGNSDNNEAFFDSKVEVEDESGMKDYLPTPTLTSAPTKIPTATLTPTPPLSPVPKDAPASIMGTSSYANYRFADEYIGANSFAIGFRKGDEGLAGYVNGAVRALVLDGTYDSIGEKYPDVKKYLCLRSEGIDVSAIAEKGSGDSGFVFKHGFDKDYPPYSYQSDDGSVGGFDVELCKAVCEYLGWGYEPVPFEWADRDIKLKEGACDCIWSGFSKEGREEEYTWGITYAVDTYCILLRGDSDINTIADLQDKVVGVQLDTTTYDILMESQPYLSGVINNIKEYEDINESVIDLKEGKIDAIVIDKVAGQAIIDKNP